MRPRLLIAAQVLALAVGPLRAQEPDADHDGVPDARDQCPNTAQLNKLPAEFRYGAAVNPERLEPGPRSFPVDASGCELDSDDDGIPNSQDYCPEDTAEALSRGVATNGCPRHSDFDGTPDYRDRCPDTPKGVRADAQGCPLPASRGPAMHGERP
jgi:OOP family OmpA-OmpF porin